MAKGEPTKATVGEALRALDARARRMEAEARRERDARARDRDALARVTESVDALAATFREAMEAISCDHDAWTRERREIKAAVEVAARAATTAATRAEARERDAERARAEALAIDARVSEGLRYVKDVRDEFVAVERVIQEAKERTRELEARDVARARARWRSLNAARARPMRCCGMRSRPCARARCAQRRRRARRKRSADSRRTCESWPSGRRRRRRTKTVDSPRSSARLLTKVATKKTALLGARES